MSNSQPVPANRAVFLSYASQDAEAARRVCEGLRATGVEVWFDQRELAGGDQWDKKIRGQIGTCALFMPVISASTQARLEGYFRIEWKLAAQRTHAMADAKPFLVPVVIDETHDADAHVPEEFHAVQWTRLHGGETNLGFCTRVNALLAGDRVHPRELRFEGTALDNEASLRVPASRSASRRWPWLIPAMVCMALVVAGAVFILQRSHTGIEGSAKEAGDGPAPAADSHTEVAALLEHVRELNSKTDVLRAELDGAVGLMEQAVKLAPADAEAWAEWALIDCRYVEEGLDDSSARLDLAQRHATQAIELSPKSAAARLAKARAMTLLSHDKATRLAATMILEPLVNEPGDRGAALILLAKMKWALGEPENASLYLDRAAKIPNRVGQVHYVRALNYLLTSLDCRQSEAEIDKALSAERAVKFLLWKSYLLMIWHGDVDGSKRLLAEIPAAMFLEDFPAAARYSILLWARDYDGAIAAMSAVPREYIESGALTGPTGYYIGYALARLGKPAAAESEWRGALQVVEGRLATRPNDWALLLFQALLQKSLGNAAVAEKEWLAFRELDDEIGPLWEENIVRLQFLPDEEAIDYLAAVAKSGFPAGLASSLRLNPYNDRLRANPRFIALLARAEADPRLSPKAEQRSAPTSAPLKQ